MSYENKIAELTEERRELVMNNTSAAKNLQMAESRSWTLEQEIVELKETVCELQLELERATRCGDSTNKENLANTETPLKSLEKSAPPTLLESVQTVNVGSDADQAQPECKQS
jgi:hypothetical protein